MGIFTRDEQRDELRQLSSEFESLRGADQERLQRYADYRAEMESSRELDATPRQGEDYGRKTQNTSSISRHRIALPFAQALTVKHSHRISARLPEVIVDRRAETAEERYRSDAMEKMVWGIIRESRGEAQIASGAWDGSQLGATVFHVYFDVGKQQPCFRAIDPSGCLVVPGVDDPHKFKRVYRFWRAPVETVKAQYRGETFDGEPVKVDDIQGDGKENGNEMCLIVQMTDENRILRFVAGNRPIGLYDYEHGYGFVPYVVIPNIGPERKIWGWADYEFVRGLLDYLPKLFSRQADVVRATANGAYTDERTGKSAKEIEKVVQEGGILPIKQGSKVAPIPAPDMPEWVTEHADTALLFVKMLGFAPDGAWGDGSAASGSDRGLQMQPMNELTALKRINWASGLGRLFKMAFQMIEKKQAGAATYRGTHVRGAKRDPFAVTFDPTKPPQSVPNPAFTPGGDLLDDEPEQIALPQDPKQIFDGDYEVRFSWLNRVDPDDPAFVMSELNKFQQAVQSLETTLERIGCDNPSDEIKRIKAEAESMPWIRQGVIAFTKAQLDANSQGEDGGPAENLGTGIDDALTMMTSKDGAAQDANGGTAGLGSSGIGQLYGA